MNNRTQSEIGNLLQRQYSVDMGDFIGRGWEVFTQHMAGFVGFTFLTGIINFILGILGIIPLIGLIASIGSLVIGGPLYAGYYIFYFKVGMNKPTTFEDFFKGFQNAYFLQVFLTTLMIGILCFMCLIPAAIAIFIISLVSNGEPEPVVLIPIAVLVLAGLAGAIYLGISYTFAVPLIVGKKLEFWPAMEISRKLVGRQWLGFLGLLIVLGLINFAGLLVCGVGLLLTMPLAACALAAAYEKIVGLPTFDPSQLQS